VSVYTLDAAGLRVHSTQTQTANDINALGKAALDRDTENPTGKLTEALEENEDILREDPKASLGILADRTGGFLIDNTNALERGFRTIDADRRFHYLLTYVPKNTDFNGEWRRIVVKVPTRNVAVRARAGYIAVRSPGAIPLLAYEGPAVAALERTPPPHELPLRVGVFNFPDAKAPGRLVVLAGTDAAALQISTTPKGYATDFTILARLKNAQGEVVRKASQPYKLTGPADKVDAVKQGDVLFFRQPEVPPGTYTLEAVVHDALAKKDAVATVPVDVPQVKPGGLLVSSLVVVRRTEKVPADERNSDNPLYIGDLLAYPNLGEPLRKSVDKTLSFFLDVRPTAGGGAPTATLELLADGKPLAQAPVQLPAPGADGRIQETAQLPLANFPPGAYVLRVTIAQGGAQETREARFSVID
jgi:hypothetical protein